MQLRPYQHECLDALREAYAEGKRRVLVSLPTGTGKTVVFAQFPSFFKMRRRLLVLAHREELLDQAREKFGAVSSDVKVGIEQAERRAGEEAQVVVASVPTLGRAHSKRLAALDPTDFHLIVVDEAHHAVAPTYRRIFDHFELFAQETKRMLVGFTATPYRGNGQGLGEVFEDICYTKAMPEMIDAGFLAPIRGWKLATHIPLDAIRVRRGDFVEAELARAIDVEARNVAIVDAYLKCCPGRRTIAFCVNVSHAQSLAAAFEQQDVRAAAVWGEMPKRDRRAVLARFEAGELDVITNCNVLTEGFDAPRVDCILMARPTHSKLLYVQMLGRGTRLHPDKEDLVVIDVADDDPRQRAFDLPDLFDLPTGFDLQGLDVQTAARGLAQVQRQLPWIDSAHFTNPREFLSAAQRIDLIRTEPPVAIIKHTKLAWHEAAGEGFCLPLPGGEAVLVQSNLLDSWDVTLQTRDSHERISREPTLRDAIKRGDRFVARARPDMARVLDLSARWRHHEATDKQCQELKRRSIVVPEGLTRGMASWMLSLS